MASKNAPAAKKGGSKKPVSYIRQSGGKGTSKTSKKK